jgi:hypothetical protein
MGHLELSVEPQPVGLGMSNEYARRFTCEGGFRDAKRLLGFGGARISCLAT